MQREERCDEFKVSPTSERVKGAVKFVSLKTNFRDQPLITIILINYFN